MFPKQKARLYGDRLRQLERLGLSSPFEFNRTQNALSNVAVEQLGSDLDSPIVGLRDGRTLYVVWLSMVAERPGVYLYDYRFEPPWLDRNFEMLPGFSDSCIGEAYVLPNQLEYPRADILNFRFVKTGWRLPCTRVEGVLCALSAAPIPEEFKHGTSVPVGLKFFGKSGLQLAAASVILWADRWHEPAVTRPTMQRLVAVDEVGAGVGGRRLRSSLYGPSGGDVVRGEDQNPKRGEGSPAAGRDREDTPRTENLP
jgi:hypothetical protein